MPRFTLPLLAVFATAAVSFGVSTLAAPPLVAPPGGNVDAPLNVGTARQDKAGSLTLASLGIYGSATFATESGNVGIGISPPLTPSPLAKLDVAGKIFALGLTTADDVRAEKGFWSSGKDGYLGTEDDLHINNPFACSDGVDNDGDGKVDYGNDPDCARAIDSNEETAAVARAGCTGAPASNTWTNAVENANCAVGECSCTGPRVGTDSFNDSEYRDYHDNGTCSADTFGVRRLTCIDGTLTWGPGACTQDFIDECSGP